MDKWVLLTILWVLVLATLLVAGAIASYLRLLMRRLTPMGARKLFRRSEGHRVAPEIGRAHV